MKARVKVAGPVITLLLTPQVGCDGGHRRQIIFDLQVDNTPDPGRHRRRRVSAGVSPATLHIRVLAHRDPTVLLRGAGASRHTSAMAQPFICGQCDRTEDKCDCDRYCILCQGQNDVRLVQDGTYYCLECREACDFQAQV